MVKVCYVICFEHRKFDSHWHDWLIMRGCWKFCSNFPVEAFLRKSILCVIQGDKEGTTEFRRAETIHSVSRSLSLDAQSSPGGKNDERNLRFNYSCRSSGHDQGSQRFSSFMRSLRNFEVVDDRFRDDDKVRNGSKNRTSEDRRFTDGKSKTEGMSRVYGKDMAMSTPPTVRPVKDSLGKNTPSLQVAESPQADGGRSTDGALDTQVRYLLTHEVFSLISNF